MKKVALLLYVVLLLGSFVCGCGDDGIKTDYITVYARTSEGFAGTGIIGTVYIKYQNADQIFCRGDVVHIEYDPEKVISVGGSLTDCDSGDTYKYECMLQWLKSAELHDNKPKNPEDLIEKPIIYLYPEETTEVEVKVDFRGTLTETIPAYNDGWRVTATPDGTIYAEDGKTYPYLFWEGIPDELLSVEEGFCVRGEDTEAFLADILPRLGLNQGETAEFMAFWLPRMENNPYNLIQFHYESYEALAPLTIIPAPDSLLRVFMTFQCCDQPIDIPAQEIRSFSRVGFTVVEWGGTEIK